MSREDFITRWHVTIEGHSSTGGTMTKTYATETRPGNKDAAARIARGYFLKQFPRYDDMVVLRIRGAR